MEVMEAIFTRHSVRSYMDIPIDSEVIKQILMAAICAPSGKNRQPWRFKVITDSMIIQEISQTAIYSRWLRRAPCCIAVFLDKEKSYDYVKDVQSCGAVMQNILLAAHGLGIGSCWIGEVVSHQDKILSMLGALSTNIELMGIITLGYSDLTRKSYEIKNIETYLL